SDVFTYVADRPIISQISPNSGPSTGGTVVTITGNNLFGATAVFFGGLAATSFTVNSPFQITATAPGVLISYSLTVDITVTTTPKLTSATSSVDLFTYIKLNALRSYAQSAGHSKDLPALTLSQVQPIVQEAISRWKATGID